MSQSGPLQYLSVSGVEVANAARTLSYLKHGLGNTLQGHFELGPGDACSVLYRTDRSGSGGSCTAESFLSPASDPAPWYSASEPGAATFLGLLLLDIEGYDSTIYRNTANRIGGLGGAVISGQHRAGRTWKFRAALVSSDDAGAEYGLRWLTHALESSFCDECATSWIAVRLVCPPDNCSDDALGLWYSYDAVLSSGPHEVEKYAPGAPGDVLAGCRDVVVVEWEMTAGNPFLYKPPVVAADFTIKQDATCTSICDYLFGTTTAVCADVTPPKMGVLGSVFELTSAAGFGGVLLEAYANCGSGGGPTLGETPTFQIELSQIPPLSTVVVDSAQHRILVYQTDPTTGKVSIGDGAYLVVLADDTAIQWLELDDCETDVACFCARAATECAAGTLDVLILTQNREG